jgi:hypothetical protein
VLLLLLLLLLLWTLPLSPATTRRPDLSSYPMALTAVWWRYSSDVMCKQQAPRHTNTVQSSTGYTTYLAIWYWE